MAYPMYYQLTPHKSTTIGFPFAFECFAVVFANTKTCFDARAVDMTEPALHFIDYCICHVRVL